MSNERNTEDTVSKILNQVGYDSNPNIIIEKQQSNNPKIDKLLKGASKSGKGKGYPEFIISFVDKPDNIVVIECKAETSKHESKTRKQYKDYAVDGSLLYASHLKDHFNVMAIAVSGESEREIKISHFLWLKGKRIYKDVSDKSILNPESLFSVIEKQSKPIREEELIKKAIEYNELLYSYSVPEVERCTLISCILVALQDNSFVASYKELFVDNDIDYNPNEPLIDNLLSACKRVLTKNHITGRKAEVILGEYNSIKQNHTFRAKTVRIKRVEKVNTVLRDLIDDLNVNVTPYVSNDNFDVLGQFYTQFIRYAGSDSKTGLVLTPPHITELFCELAVLSPDDKVFDPCCGTGGFLVSAMKFMIGKTNDIEKHKKIKTNQLMGIEIRSDMFTHACSNMMMRGDGKSHIHFGDCFDTALTNQIKAENPTKVFLNPPYNVGADGQLEFIENAMDCMQTNGICVAICQMSTVVSTNKSIVEVKKRLLEKHTLEAVLSMPDDLFHPIGVITCILVFKSGTPHPVNKKSFFGYFKDDGFTKAKHKGRIDIDNKWQEIKEKWLNTYINRESIPGLSVTKEVKAEDEWCAEAYMETDYSTLTDDDFIKTIKDYVAFQFINGDIDE